MWLNPTRWSDQSRPLYKLPALWDLKNEQSADCPKEFPLSGNQWENFILRPVDPPPSGFGAVGLGPGNPDPPLPPPQALKVKKHT